MHRRVDGRSAGALYWAALAASLAAVLAFLTPAHAAPAHVLDYDDARHLLTRAGFAPTETEVRAIVGSSRAAAVDRLLATARTTPVTPVPAVLTTGSALRPARGPDATPEERKAFVRAQVQDGLALRGWWLQEMLTTPSPLTERMTLFWHNHFVSAQPKVRVTRLMFVQNTTLRANALGNFGTLLHAVAKDPAMIVYLDGAQNRKGAPNENFARELMELFTLGEGHYSEADVKEAARAFTGWSLDRDTGTFVMRPRLHDGGIKTILGRTGRFDGDDVLDLLLARPETAVFITAKLWREFISPDPDASEVARIARAFRASHYDLRTVVGELLRSDAFYAPANRGVLVKSPVEVVVGALRQFDLAPADAVPFALAAAAMGQNLYSPPNVKGWPGGDAWINTSTLLARKQFLERFTRGDDPGAAMRPAAVDALATTTPAPAAMEMAPAAPRKVLAAAGDIDPEKGRALRFARAMQRGLASVHFDSARWMTPVPGDERRRAQSGGRAAPAADCSAAAPRFRCRCRDPGAQRPARRGVSAEVRAPETVHMNRRLFLKTAGALAAWTGAGMAFDGASVAWAAAGDSRYRRTLVLIELKGGNDGLNTVVPFTDPAYYALRPKIAIARDAALPITDKAALHPALAPLMPLWEAREMAVLQSVGYPAPNLSHFRSIEIWDTASASNTYLADGWLTRAFATAPTPAGFAADGVAIGTSDLGPLSGSGTRAVALTNTDQFLRQARLATPQGQAHNKAFEHILKVEGDVVQAASHLGARHAFATAFPAGGFGNAVRTAAQILASPAGVAVVRVTLNGFDTHSGQAPTQARLFGEFAQGIVALRSALIEIGRWDDSLILTYAEFGRRPRENLSQGTDHGTANVHFAWGGKVTGGAYGAPPALDRLDGNGNIAHALDFRSVYATVLERWWDIRAREALGGDFAPVPFLRA